MSTDDFNRYCIYNIIIDNKILAFSRGSMYPARAYFVNRDDLHKHLFMHCNFKFLLEGPSNLILLNPNFEEATLTADPPINNPNISNASFNKLDATYKEPYAYTTNIDYGCYRNYINGNQSLCRITQQYDFSWNLGYDINGDEGNGKYRAIYKRIDYSKAGATRNEEFAKYFNVSIREKCSYIDSLYNECKDDKDLGVDYAYPYPPYIPPSASAGYVDTLLPCTLLGLWLVAML